LTGTTDFQVITQRAKLGEPASNSNPDRLAFDLFTDRILNYIGSYYLKLSGEVDALVFAGGIGERSKELRAVIGEKVQCLGFAGVDESKNEGLDARDGVVFDISLSKGEGNGKRLFVCRTDEQVRTLFTIMKWIVESSV
jgi:acetate kinase